MTYRNPALTVDALVSRLRNRTTREILLIKRGRDPFKGSWAFPGGFVDEGEDPLEAVKRELFEETHLKTLPGYEPKLVTVEGSPKRDPRKHIVTIAYHVEHDPSSEAEMRGDDDASEAKWHSFDQILKGEVSLAFDHLTIAKKYFEFLKSSEEK